MKIIGVTGGIGSGKSTVCGIASQMYSINVINADELSREVVNFEDVKTKLKEKLGSEIFINDELDRKKTASLIFEDEVKRKEINAIIHPRVKKLFLDYVQEYDSKGCQFVIYECPLLIEEGLTGDVDTVLLIYSPIDSMIKNIISRDTMTENEAKERIAAQMDIDEKISYADAIIYNDGGIEDLKNAVRIVFDSILKCNE